MNLLVQLLKHNDCYAADRRLTPIGVMVHATGANNPNVSRYVPGNEVIGRNTAGNHWDHSNEEWREKFGAPLDKCVHAFIGKIADGSVATVQTMPWSIRGWHAGNRKGNDRYIGFEICEDGLDDPIYFAAVYREAAELTAMLCAERGWDPLADGVVICHAEGYKRGVASNHGDVLHWFPRHGKTMDDFRADVARIMRGEEDEDMTQEQFDAFMENWLQRQAEKPVSEWAEKLLDEAMSRGITDGTRPQAWATRQEVALMVNAGTK